MRLAIVEDDVSILDNLKILLDGEPEIDVVGAFGTARDALEGLGPAEAHVLLVDLGLPDMHGVDLIRQVKAAMPELDIIVYTMFDDWGNVFSAIKAGASGYILKGTTPRQLIEAVLGLYRGDAPMSPKIARMVIAEFRAVETDALEPLTQREKEILRYMDRGMTYKEIAYSLHLSPHTVRTHIKHIYEKLQARNKEEALRKARKKNAL